MLGPRLDTAGDIAHARETLGAEILGHAEAPGAVMAVDEEVFLAWQVTETLGNLAQRDRFGAGDRADLEFEGLAHVDQVRVGCGGGQEAVRCFDGEFEWDGVGCHEERSGRAGEIVAGGIEGGDDGFGAAKATGGVPGNFKRGEILAKGVVGEEASTQRFADAGDELDRFERLKTADDAAERAEDARLTAVGDAAGRRRFGEKAAVARAALGGVEDAHLALEAVNAAIDQRPAGESGGVVVEVTAGEIIRAVDDDIVAGEERESVGDRDALGVFDDGNERIGGAEAARSGRDLEFADGGVLVEKLALKVVGFDAVEVGDAEGADAGGREVKGSGTTEAAGADDEDPGGGELLLAGDAELI